MKKFYLILLGVATLSFATLSCSKEAVDPSQQEQTQKEEPQKEEPTSENPADEDDTPVPEGMVRLTFGVSHEGDAPATEPETEDSKTSWDGSTHAWSDGDQIRIFWGTGAEEYVDATVKNNQVEAVVGEADNYYAVYPITGAFAFREGDTIDFGIPILQSGSFKDANMMAAATSKTAATFNFKNLTHIFKFHLTNDSPYDRFQICTNNGSIVVNTYGVSFDSEGNVTIGTKTEEISGFANSKYVRLHEGMTPGGDYYFAVVPGAQYSLGFGLQARIRGETGDYSVAALSKGKIDTSNPRKITNLGDLDSYVHSDWFITADGTGNGTSWDNPGGPSLLRSLLVMPSTFTADQAKKNHTIRLNNAKIHLKEGTYNFQTILSDSGIYAFQSGAFYTDNDDATKNVNNVTLIEGGYPTSATDKDLSGYDPVNHPSVVISNQAAQNDRAFYFNGARLFDWTFKGLSFKNNPDATNYNTPGGAVAINGATRGNIKFEDCSFSIKTTNGSGGGALSFRGTGEVYAEFKNCVFSSCESTSYGGAIWINTTNHNLTFDGCTITDNKATIGGGFIYAQNSGVVTFQNDTSFERNTSDEESGLGGAIYTHESASGTINLDNCSFSENSAYNGGAIFQQGGVVLKISAGTDSTKFIGNKAFGKRGGAILCRGELNIDNAAFRNNNGSNGGAIHLEAGAAVVISNSTFKRNTATNGGAIRTDGECHLTIDKCSFTLNESAGGEGGALNIVTGTTDVTLKNSSISNCSAKKGGAICISQTTSTTYIPVSLYNTSIINNTATAGAGGIMSTGKNDLIMVNCTVSSNSGTNGGGIYVTRYNSNSSYITRLSMVSCTVTNNTASTGCGGIYRDTYGQVVDVYNCIISGNTGTDTNNDVRNAQLLYHVNKSIVNGTSYISADRVNNNAPVGSFQWRKSELSNPSAFNVATMLSPLSTDVHSVLNVSENPAKMCGMSYDDLSSLSLSATPTQTVDTSFFTIDQKGNSREGKTTMGAYVGE